MRANFVFFDRSLATFLASDKVTELTYIGVGRFRILGLGGGGGARFRILGGGQGGAKFPAGT